MPWHSIRDPDALGRLIDAILVVGTDLSLENVLHRIVEAAVGLVDARYGALGVLDASLHSLSEFVTVGLTPEQVEAIGALPSGHGILGAVITSPEPLRLARLSSHPDSYGFPDAHPPMASFLGVPIRIHQRYYGNLYLTDKISAPEFSADDEGLAIALAKAAALAIDNARLHAQVRDLALGEDRERIAADLHDTVIQRLFATGLALESSIRMASPEVAARIEQSVTDLDETIRQIRAAIFALHVPRTPGHSLRGDIVAVVADAARSLGFEPNVRVEGPIDSAVPPDTVPHVIAVLTEALSNVARHARATEVNVMVESDGRRLLVVIDDDGVGVGTPSPGGTGLGNLQRRAELLGGAARISARENGGTRVEWDVPVT